MKKEKNRSVGSKYASALKLLILGGIVLVLLIPLGMISGTIYSRKATRNEAIHDIYNRWGDSQTLAGPYIEVPMTYETKKQVRKLIDEEKEEYEVEYEITTHRVTRFYTPRNLYVIGHVNTELRALGIFSAPVYTADVTISGDFAHPVTEYEIPRNYTPLWDEAVFHFDLTEPQSLQAQPELQIDSDTYRFLPQSSGQLLTGSLSTEFSMAELKVDELMTFSISLKLRGSEKLRFFPTAEENHYELTSNWPSPSFTGIHSPFEREVSEEGFSAKWGVIGLARTIPDQWTSSNNLNKPANSNTFGASFVVPVSAYQLVTRSVKYGVLFILLPFIAFYFFELFQKRKIHPIQYLFVGLTTTLFFMLILSLSEHIAFNGAYWIGAAGTIALISVYAAAMLKSKSKSLIIAGILSGLYLFLFVMLQSEDYALLIGTIGLFVILAAIMIMTRKVDWYGAQNSTKEAIAEKVNKVNERIAEIDKQIEDEEESRKEE